MKGSLFCLILTLSMASAVLPSCSTRIEGTLRQDGSADFSVEASLEPRMTTLIRSLSRVMGQFSGNPGPGASGAGGGSAAGAAEVLFDGPGIAKSMTAAPGVASANFSNTGPAAITGTIGLSRVDAFLAAPVLSAGSAGSGGGTGGDGGGSRFIRYESDGRLLFTVDRGSGPLLLSLFSQDISDYLSALMAPVVTGETLGKTEYLNLVASFYGRPLADEIAASRINIAIDFPRPITAIRGGTARGSRAQFAVPLLDLLVLESPLTYEVVWK
ncbi:MAG: hypothetical protein LBQ38_08825 [Spirochaetaceae bacterium]|jgi:hypothetical protein|nr:hypothetical protein [Spirochaetaceae bacterium]